MDFNHLNKWDMARILPFQSSPNPSQFQLNALLKRKLSSNLIFWPVGLKKIFCVPLCAELHEGVEKLRQIQNKAEPVVNGKAKVSVTTLKSGA